MINRTLARLSCGYAFCIRERRLLFALVITWFLSPLPGNTPASLDWRLEPQKGGGILWEGQLPAAPRSIITWRASAVWASAWDSSETVLLADTGWIDSEYYPRHRVPLSRLSPPPGPGAVRFTLRMGAEKIEAAARVAGPATGYEELLEKARRRLDRLQAELIVARRYGVRRPEAESLLAIGDIYLDMAKALRSNSARLRDGRWWLEWLCRRADEAIGVLRRIRTRPEEWTIVHDPPLGELQFDATGNLLARVWTPEGHVYRPVRLVGLSGEFRPGDAGLIHRMGFNLIAERNPGAEVVLEATRLNIALISELPMQESSAATVFDGWEPYRENHEQPLADQPWRLYRASLFAIRTRAGLPALKQGFREEQGLPQLPLPGSPPPWEMFE